MHSYSPIQIAVFVIGLLAVVGVAISYFRKSATLAGYSEYKGDIEKIGSTLKAETFRDGDDVVITGNHKQNPVQIRFSYSENTPGVIIRMGAPVSFTFSVVPKGERASEGRVLVKTGHDMFDARFAARTDHPTQAKMLVGGRAALANIEKLCCSSKTFFTMTRGTMEVVELVIPAPYTARHVLDHLESMAVVAAAVDEIPGADQIKVQPYTREKTSNVIRAAIVVGAVVAIFAVLSHPQQDNALPADASNGPAVQDTGVPINEAVLIPTLEGYKAPKPEELDSDAASWIRSAGGEASSRLQIDFTGSGDAKEVAYLLITTDGQRRRIAILQDGKDVFDRLYPGTVAIARLPKSNMSNIEWTRPPASAPQGDALLLLQKNGDQLSAVALYLANGRFDVALPKDYSQISLQ